MLTLIILCSIGVGNAWGYTGTFTNYTNATLIDGYYIICPSTSASNTNYCAGTDVSSSRITGKSLTSKTNPANAYVWIIENTASGWTFNNYGTSTKYIRQKGTSSGGGMEVNTTIGYFTLAGYNSSSPVGYKFTSADQNSNNQLKWNNSSKWFANYANAYSTSMTPVCLYRDNTKYRAKTTQPATGSFTASATSATWDGTKKHLSWMSSGTTVSLTATPPSGKEVDAWTVTKATGGTVSVSNNQFTMPADQVTITVTWKDAAPSCTAPDHVNITGRWDRFGGETISLTATPYDGSDQEITTGITGYQWQKYYNSTWNNIAGATSATYTKSNCDKDDSGSYRCVVSTGATCSTPSDGFQVKVYVLECYTGGTTIYNFTRIGDTQAGTVQVPMNTANTGYTFKVHADNDYYGNNGTINEDVTNWVMCNNSTAECTTNLTVNSGLGGTFTFTMDYSTGGSSSVEGEPEISVTYPRKTIYFTPGVWNSGNAKFAFYYFRDGGSNGWTGFITANDCGSSADIPQWNGVKVNAVRLNSSCSSPNWSDKWNQTSNITVTSNNSISITGWGPQNGDSPYDYGTYSTPTYTISYAAGTGGSGSKDSESKTCGVDFTLPSSAVFTRTGYTQTGWATEDGGTKVYDLGDSYPTNAAQTFYPFWTVNSHTLTWDFDGGSSSETAGTDYTAGGSVNYGTTIDYPSNASMSKAGYTFTGWSSSPATMPDADLTITAQWSVKSYNITWSVNNQTWTNGVTDANNHANHGATVNAPAGDGNVPTGAAMPCGTYTFMGWSAAITPTSEDGGTAPADLFTTTSPAITQETTFYAVFAETSGSGGGWTRLTNVSQLSAGQQIIMGYEETANSGTIVPVQGSSFGSNLLLTGTTLGSAGSGTITMASNTDGEGYYFTLHEGYNTGYWSFEQSGEQAGKYFGYNNRNAVAQNNSIQTDGKTDYSITLGDNNKATIVNKYGHENTYYYSNKNRYYQYLRYNYNNGNPRVVLYETGMEDLVLFYKNPVSYSNYKTYCDNTKAYVNYNAAGGTTSCEREAVTKGSNYTVCSSTPTKTGYTFQGWLSDETTPQTYQPNATISNVQNDIILTAQWTATTYTITYNGVKTGATNINPTSYTVEDLPINLVAATHDQWRFDGWTDDNAGDADITTIPAGTTGNQSFTAHWTQRYAVTWYVESATTVEYYDPGETLVFPSDPDAPTSCGSKVFVGWMVGTITGETDDKPTFITAGEVNADAAYHAVWADAAGSAIAAVEDNTFTQSDVSQATYCGISNGLKSVGKYVQNQSIWNSTQMTGVNVKIKVYHVSNSTADVLRISLINSSGAEVVGTDLTTSKLGNGSSSAGYSSNVTLTPTTAVTGYKVSLKTKNSNGTSVGRVTREVVPAYSKYATSCCDNNVAAPNVTATATRNSITLSWTNVTDATGYKVTINGATHDVTTAACTYTESGLDSGTDYAWTVVATYNPANYCGAIPTKNTTTTLSVYSVTYNKNTTIGSGTVTMSPMPSDASTYVVGENVTAAAKPTTCTNAGYSFNGWNTEPDGTGIHVDAEGTIAMVEGGLTLYAEWVAKRAYYVDRMHGQGDHTIEIGGKTYHCYYGDGYHTTPSPSDQKSGDACQTPHYRFVRWLTITHINNDGTQKDTGGAVGGGVQRGTVTDGETYYAIWEEEIEE